ncbi:MAG: hypothetical protein WAW37_00060 [Syntrophobacteraceae bacterium]
MRNTLEDMARDAPNTFESFSNLLDHLSGKPIYNQTEDLHHWICAPGHLFVKQVFDEFYNLGSPGYLIPHESLQAQFGQLQEVIARGNVHPTAFALLVQFMGFYVLYLWVIHCWVAGSEQEHKDPVGIQFEYDMRPGSAPSAFPPLISKDITLEWWWVWVFIDLADNLKLSNFNSMPGILSQYLQTQASSKAQKEREKLFRSMPFDFQLQWVERIAEHRRIKITSTPRYRDEIALIPHVFDFLARFEIAIRFYSSTNRDMWETLRNPETQDHVLTSAQTQGFFRIQEAAWPEAFCGDKKLASTALLSITLQKHGVAQKRADPLRLRIDKAFSRACNIKAGNVNRYKKVLTDKDKQMLRDIRPDLVALSKRKTHKFKKITPEILRKRETLYPTINEKDWNDLTVKVAATYIRSKTPDESPPTLTAVTQFLKKIL